VIPTTWLPVTRACDGERVGWLAPEGDDGAVVPTSLVGVRLGPAQEPAAAAALLREHGLRSLDRRWWCRLPDPLPAGVVPAANPAAGWEWRPVVLVEVSGERCTVRLEMAEPAELRARAELPVPVGDLLRHEPPPG
jgi:hypothetical protein